MKLSVSLPNDLVARLDQSRGLVPRSAWIAWAIEQALGGGVLLKAVSELRGRAERAEEVREALRSEPAEPPQPSPGRSPVSEEPLSRSEAFRRATRSV